VKDGERSLKEAVTGLRANLDASTRRDVGDILERAQKTLRDGGINLTISFPAPSFNTDESEGIRSGSLDAVRTRSWTETRRREKDGVLPWFARKLWGGGYEEFQKELTESSVDIRTIRDGVEASLNRAVGDIRDQASEFVDEAIKPAIGEYFSSLRTHLEAYRTELLDGIRDQENSKEKLAELRNHIEKVAEQAGTHRQDLMNLAQNLPRVEGAPVRSAS
jgi:hypothetical protein